MHAIASAISRMFGRGHRGRGGRPRHAGRQPRRLAVEPLEDRALLSITITGTVTVINLPGSASSGPVPIRGAEVHGGGGDTVSTDADGRYTVSVPALSQPGNCVGVTVTARADTIDGGYDVESIASDGWVVPGEMIDVGYSETTVFYARAGPPQASYTDNIVLDARDPVVGCTAQALAILSTIQTFYDYAASVGANLPHLDVGYPYTQGISHYSSSAGNILLNPDDLFDTQDSHFGPGDLFAAVIGHEFGHYVARNNGFAGGRGGVHYLDFNQRLVRGSSLLGTRDQGTAFSEGWADYYAVAAAVAEPAPNMAVVLPSLANLASARFGKIPMDQDAGYGEDNEISDMLILWNLANTPSQFLCATGLSLFQLLHSSHVNTLEMLWNDLIPSTSTPTGACNAADLGRLFEREHVSGTIAAAGVNQGQQTFTFTVPNLHGTAYSSACTMNYAEVQVFDGSWNVVWSSDAVLLPADLLGAYATTAWIPQAVLSGNGASTTYTMKVPDGGWAQIADPARGAVRHWVVEVGAYMGLSQAYPYPATAPAGGVSGLYWSHAEQFNVAATAMVPTRYRSGIVTDDVASNDPQLVYDIALTSGADSGTIPGYTVTVYPSTSGDLDDPGPVPVGSYYVGYSAPGGNTYFIDATSANYLAATADDYERAITLPASALDPNVLAGDPDGYLLAKIHFDGDTTDADDIWVRFEGGAFQTTGGAVWAYASSSLDDVTPDSNNPDTIGVATTQSGVTVSDVGGAEWDPVSYDEAFASVCGNTTVFAHEGSNAITATSADRPSGVDIQAGDGSNTIDGTGVDWLGGLRVQAGNGDNTVLGGAGTVDVTAGAGDNTVDCSDCSGLQVQLGDGSNTVYGCPGDNSIAVGDGDNAVHVGGCGEDYVDFGTGDNTFLVDATAAGPGLGISIQPSWYVSTCGTNTLELECTGAGPLPDLSDVALPAGYLVLPAAGGSPSDDYGSLQYSGIAQLGLDFEGGGTIDLPAMPAGTNITVSSGTTLDMADNTTPLGTVTLEDGALDLGGTAQTVAGLDGDSTSSVVLDDGQSPGTLNVQGNGACDFAGTIGGSGGLDFLGTDPDNPLCATLSGDNTYTGATQIGGYDQNAGQPEPAVLTISTSAALGGGTAVVSSGSQLALDGSGGAFSVATGILLYGTGPYGDGAIRNLAGDNTLSGTITVGQSTQVDCDADTLTLSGNIVAMGGSTDRDLAAGGAGDVTISGAVGGSSDYANHPGWNVSALVLDGSGMLILANDDNTYAGTTEDESGTLDAVMPGSLPDYSNVSVAAGATLAVGVGAGEWTSGTPGDIEDLLAAATFDSGAFLGFDTTDGNYTYVTTGLPDTLGLAKLGTGTLTVTGQSSYTGGTDIEGGTLVVGVSSNLGDSGGALTVNGGTLDLDGNSLTVGSLSGYPGGTITDNSDGSGTTTLTVAEAADTWFGGTIEDGQYGQTLGLVMDGAGTLVLTGANSFTGGAQIDERGTLQVGDGTTDGSLAGNVAVDSGGTLVFDVAAVDQYMGQISGEGGLVKEGDGVLTLDGANSCAGTTVLGGILAAVDPVDITYGTALADGQLSGSVIWAVDGSPVSVAGTFSYGSAAGTVLGAGGGQAEAVTFTPTDTADYTAVSTTAAVSVGQATPTITWAAPPAIAYGTALGDTQLDAASSWTVGGAPGSVDGTFTYTPAAGQVLAAGSQTLSVTFTPADAVDYSPATATVSITVNPPPASVVGEYVFYNESIWGTTVAPDKSALLPGEAASFANYTSYDEGLNGIAVDIANLPGTSLSAGDFQFSVGNGSVTDGSTWALASAAPTVTVVPGGGTGGSSRVLLVWADNAIQDTWLRVEVLADADTGLAAPFVFYFGNQIGSTGTAPNAKVTAIDLSAVVNNAQPSGASITNPYDFNRDGKVTAIDVSIVVNNAAAGTAIKFFTPTDT